MDKPHLGVSIMPEPDFLQAVLPLLQDGDVEAIEWSFDTIQFEKHKPKWLNRLLQEYADNNRLIGHGVYYSLFQAKWSKEQANWLKKLKKEVVRYNYRHISEHFGFMSDHVDHHKGCPFPVPLNKTILAIGIDRLQRLQDAAQLPVGVENLAFSFSKCDVEQQGEFITKLIEPINGFVILDLHNIYCQSENFGIDMMDLIDCYPLSSVKEIHISGGSWQESVYQGVKKRIRRDTHDGHVPKKIFDVLPAVLQKCKSVEFVIFEKMGNSFQKPGDFVDYRNDFNKLKNIIENTTLKFEAKEWGNKIIPEKEPVEDELLFKEQNLLSKTLLGVSNYKELLSKINLKRWEMDKWDPGMIDTAIAISKKWS